MKLKDGRRNARRYRAEEGFADDVRLVFARNDENDAACEHDGLHAHGVRLTRHIIGRGEKALVRLDGGLGEVDAVRALGEIVVRLVEADVTVETHAEQLEVDAARGADCLVVAAALALRVKLCDMAPELPGAMETIEELSGEVRISLAHTEADYDTACEAFRRGARQATHLFNAMPPFSHRAPGVIGAAFDSENVAVELIADGVHIHPSVVRAVFTLFSGRVILISDSMMATGLADGEYSLGGQAVTVRGNLATLHDGTIAGSATNLMDCVRSAVRMGIPLGEAVRSASTNPARALGIENDYGSLEAGRLANVVLLDEELNIHAVLLRGRML